MSFFDTPGGYLAILLGVTVAFIAVVLIGDWLNKHARPLGIVLALVVASIVIFALTGGLQLIYGVPVLIFDLVFLIAILGCGSEKIST